MSASSGWLALNDDALLESFAFFDMRSMLRAAQVCRRFRALGLATPGLWWDVQMLNSQRSSLARFIEVLLRSTRAGTRVLLYVTATNLQWNHYQCDVVDLLHPFAHRIAELRVSNAETPCAPYLLFCSPCLRFLDLGLHRLHQGWATSVNFTLRRIRIRQRHLAALPVLEGVVEVDVALLLGTHRVMCRVFAVFPRVRRLTLRNESLQYATAGDDIRSGSLEPVCLQRLAMLEELRIVSRGLVYKEQYLRLVNAQIPLVSFSLTQASSTAHRALRRALQTLPGPWMLFVRHAVVDSGEDAVTVCIIASGVLTRVWTLERGEAPVAAVILPLVLDTHTSIIGIDGLLACGMVYSAMNGRSARDFAHVQALCFVLPFVPPQKPLALHDLRTVVFRARAGCRAFVSAALIRKVLEQLPPPPPPLNIYVVAIHDVIVKGDELEGLPVKIQNI